MRDYSNIPTLKWQNAKNKYQAESQILHEEPVILEMPESFRCQVDGTLFGGLLNEETGIYYDCDAVPLLSQLAEDNMMPSLGTISAAASMSSSISSIVMEGTSFSVQDIKRVNRENTRN